jgi:hypothetical protein
MRRPVLAALTIATLVASLPVASATPGLSVVDCDISISAFGVGAVTASGTCTVTGEHAGTASLSLAVHEPAATCPLVGTAAGRLTGSLNADVTWTRPGTVTMRGDHTGTGPMTLVVTSPVGNPCGLSNVRVRVTMSVVE